MGERLRIWAAGCSHIGHDIDQGIESLRLACEDAEDFGFDIAVSLGDISGQQGLPHDSEGLMYRQQLLAGLKNHAPEHFYPLQGNHDRTDLPGRACGEWFNKYMDPLCTHSATSGMRADFRPFPITDGTWDGYEVRVGSISMLLMSDINRPLTPRRGELGGDPAGVVDPLTYGWWKSKCSGYATTDTTVLTFAHYMPKETTTATAEYGGGYVDGSGYHQLYHGAGYTEGRASSYLAFVGEEEGRPFIDHLEQNPGQCQLWVGAHNHVLSGKNVGGLKHIETKHGCIFVQNGALTRLHHGAANERNPKSRFYEFESGSNVLKIHAYMHENAFNFTKGLWSTVTHTLPKAVMF